MPNNAVRITLNRPIHSSPGCHAYLWIPGIRLMETHPFTLVSQNPAQFVVRAYDGFTQDLHKVASQYPNGKTLRCSVDGAYGQVPDFFKFDRVLLVAGGSGASFTFSVALDMVRKYHDSDSDSTKMMDFVWVVRNYGTYTRSIAV
jgi:predicted ferric reductase